MNFDSKIYVDPIRNLNDLVTIINYYYPNKLKNNRMVCPFHNDKNPSFYIINMKIKEAKEKRLDYLVADYEQMKFKER